MAMLLVLGGTAVRGIAEPVSPDDQEMVTEELLEPSTEVTQEQESEEEQVVSEEPAQTEDGQAAEGVDVTTIEGVDQQLPDAEAPQAAEGVELRTLSEDADEVVGGTASVGRSRTVVRVSRVGTSGTAQVYAFKANEYFVADNLKGMSEKVADRGILLGSYTCGSTQEFEFNRYSDDGYDSLYYKYYVIQDGNILVGPFYASDIYSTRNNGPFEVNTKKGIIHEDDSSPAMADEMGTSNTVVNFDMGSLIYAKEDANGNPIDPSTYRNVIEYECNGETYYFNSEYIKAIDGDISEYSKRGINVTLVVICWYNTNFNRYPSTLAYNTTDNHQTVAFNTSNDKGMGYWIAAMEFIADRYSRGTTLGLVDKFIINNEIDYTYDWSLITPEKDENGNYMRADFDVFMEEYARCFRLANNAVKKFNAGAKVVISLTHNWAESRGEAFKSGPVNSSSRVYNSYRPKEILDWMSTVEKARGDYDWAVSVHPYPIGTTSSNPLKTDLNTGTNFKEVNGDWRTSPWITCINLELYQQYFEQPVNMYNGTELREVTLTETSVCNVDKNSVSPEQYNQALREQAATIAQYYYRAANIDCITEMAYFMAHDISGSYKLGLMESDGTKKPSYDVWKYVDTNLTYAYANRYLNAISDTAQSYKDVMDATGSGYDWDTKWSEDNIIRRYISSDVERSLMTDLESYESGQDILVTATGSVGDVVGLFKATDDVDNAEPIYSYTIGSSKGDFPIKSGKTLNFLAYASASSGRTADANLPAGDYVVALKRGDTNESITRDITITGNYPIGKTDLSISTDKEVYKAGEPIVVTATGNKNCWAGIYKKDDKYGTGNTTSIYWYYVNDPASGIVSGKPTIIQTTIHNTDSSNPGTRIASGEYVVYLFDGSGGNDYNEVKKVNITIEPAPAIAPLESITYDLSDDTDGLANGMVTITKDEDNDSATNCFMYWADENGQPLEGYTALAKFKLTGAVTRHEMYKHTIIPVGARKLIAYASDGEQLSDDYVSCDLPEGCSYELGEPLAEFQIISDVHVTTDSGARNEVRLSNQHFKQMLEDVKKNSTNSIGIFINGDIANTGMNDEFKKVYNLYYNSVNEGNGTLPYIHMAVGNHDWIQGNPSQQFQKWAKALNDTLPNTPEHVYYDEVVDGYHFIYLGGEEPGLSAVMSSQQLQWFDQKMEQYTAEDPNKPIFLFLHQSMYNTVAGSLPGQGWDGVSNEQAFKRILKKYGQIVLVNGHSHWELNSERCMYDGDDEAPVAFNTAAVGYLWSSYNVIGGEFADGSHGYYVRVYDDKVVFMGRDFENNLWIPSAIFVAQENKISTEKDAYTIPIGSEAVNLDAQSTDGTEVNFISTNPQVANITVDGTVIPRKIGETYAVITAYGSDTLVMSRKRVKINVVDGSVIRIAGNDRYETSRKIADNLKKVKGVDKFDAVVLASGSNFPDALGGSYLAYTKNAPILLTSKDFHAYVDVNAYIKSNLASKGTIYVLGGEVAVPEECLKGLSRYNIVRLKGDDRYATNLEILKEAGVANEDILIATGKNYADSLSASGQKRPILLVGDSLNDSQKEFLAAHASNDAKILGGELAVSPAIQSQIEEIFGASKVKRISGDSRYETSAAIARELSNAPGGMIVAYGENFPDGLCGGPLASSLGMPLILTREGADSVALAYAKENDIKSGYALGGTTVLPDGVVRVVFQMTRATEIKL